MSAPPANASNPAIHPVTKGEPTPTATPSPALQPATVPAKEVGGREGPEPTRFGDWEKAGRCIDF